MRTVINFNDERQKRDLPTKENDVRVIFADMVVARMQELKKQRLKELP